MSVRGGIPQTWAILLSGGTAQGRHGPGAARQLLIEAFVFWDSALRAQQIGLA
jgi:hypothetical protein